MTFCSGEGDSENVPEKALDFFKSSTAQEVQTELKGLEQYTSDQLNFEESKISNKKSTEVNDPNLTLGECNSIGLLCKTYIIKIIFISFLLNKLGKFTPYILIKANKTKITIC